MHQRKFATLSLLAFAALSLASADSLPRRGALGLSFAPLAGPEAEKLQLKPGQGAIVKATVPGLTGEKAGLKEGDILLSLNGKALGLAEIGPTARELPAGKPVTFRIVRAGKEVTLKATLEEKPRDPGNANYSVEYSHIVSNGKKMRTIITRPKTSGKAPAFFFIQGFSPISYDFVLEKATGDVTSLDGPLLYEFANSGYVTIRVEKPGVGDSEGGPFADLDYTTELDIYRQTLKQLKSLPEVDTDNVFIFGHSMGGAFGPMIAVENPVKGIAVYGTASRTWFEYILDTLRYQGLVGGATYAQADDEARVGSRVLALVFHENQSPAAIKKAHPELTAYVDALFPGGMFNGKSLEFWRQLGQINFADYWTKVNTRVLAVRGSSDFVTYDVDHKLIADIVNREHAGWGKFALAPDSDHLFHEFKTEAESQRNFSRGKFTAAFTKMLKEWIASVRADKG